MRTIVAISGDGFSEKKSAYIDEYLRTLVNRERELNIAFVSTASKDSEEYIEKFYDAFSKDNCSHFLQEQLSEENMRQKLLALDILYVGGGDTLYLVKTWKRSGFIDLVREAYNKGVIIAGISAGAMCWFEQCFNELDCTSFEGFAWLKGSYCPHYNEVERKKNFDTWADNHQFEPYYALKDPETLLFQNEQLIAKIITY